MSTTQRISLALATLFSAALLPGCGVWPAFDSTSAHAPEPQPMGDEKVVQANTPTRLTPRFNGGPDARPEFTSSEPVQFTNVVSVGLYGETAPGETPNVAMQGDGNIKQVSFAPEGGDFTPDIDRTGSFLVYASKQHSLSFDIYRKAIDGRTVTQITSDPSDDMMPAISPDGKYIAFVSNRNGNWDVFTMPTEGGPPTQITFESDDEVQPTWSPDGRQLAFARKNARTSRWEIWTAIAHQPSGSTFLCEGFLPRWCPDSSRDCILFQRARQQGSRFYGIWTIDLQNGQAANPTEIVSAQNAAVIQPSWAPDGRRIVFTTVVDPVAQSGEMPEQSDLWVINIDGTGRMSLTGGHFRNMQPVWGSDDNIYFVSNRAGVENLWSVSPTLGGGGAMSRGGSVANAPTDEADAEHTEPATTPEGGH